VGSGFGAPPRPAGSRPGEVDFRLARASKLASFRTGRASRAEVCDAQPELLRNARACSRRTRRTCPICDHRHLVEVTYVFGPRLPRSGRCITSPGELTTLAARAGRYEAWEVEVCAECGWNHVIRTYPLTAAS
jgi:hypothetical protein